MNLTIESQFEPEGPAHEFAQRCAQLVLPVWYAATDGRITQQPGDLGLDPLVARWFESDALNLQIVRPLPGWFEQNRPEPLDLWPGCRIIPLVNHQGSRRLGISLVMVISPSGLDASQFKESAEAAGLDHDLLHKALTPLAQCTPANTSVTEQTLHWIHDDLIRSRRDNRTIAEFSEKLAGSYEEITMLHRLGRSMSGVDRPESFVAMMCGDLHENLPFAWIAVYFGRNDHTLSDLAEHVELLGRPTISSQHIRNHCESMLENTQRANWPTILSPQTDELAASTSSEILTAPIVHDETPIGVVLAGNKSDEDPEVSSVEMKFLNAAADFLGIYHENAARYVEQHQMFLGTLQALTASVDAKDPYTFGHSERVAYISSQLALHMGLGFETAERYRIAGLVHDVGKIGIPESVLCKAGRLTKEEFEKIKEHPVIGYEILKDIPPLADVLPGVLYHHERFDGRGYPEGRIGEDIPMIGRVMAVADTFDAMSSTRSYRPALARTDVLREIEQCAATQFDPKVAERFPLVDLAEFDKMHERHQARSSLAA